MQAKTQQPCRKATTSDAAGRHSRSQVIHSILLESVLPSFLLAMACPYHPRAGTQPAILPACRSSKLLTGTPQQVPTTKAQRHPTHTGTPTNGCLKQNCTHQRNRKSSSVLHCRKDTQKCSHTHKTRLVQRTTATRGACAHPLPRLGSNETVIQSTKLLWMRQQAARSRCRTCNALTWQSKLGPASFLQPLSAI